MPIHVVVGLFKGVLSDLEVFVNKPEALKKRDQMLSEYDLTQKDEPDNQHNPDCRWNDENESTYTK